MQAAIQRGYLYTARNAQHTTMDAGVLLCTLQAVSVCFHQQVCPLVSLVKAVQCPQV